ncbi:MAG: superoxide dismutase, partial [Proteobacteria bacterium]|nr:superoxide dismutase [Pseudomonadota bacterium]
LFWLSMTPNGGGVAPSPLLEKINEAFGGFDSFKEQFVNAGIGQFGSGWVWLVLNKGKLEIVKTANAETPLTDGKTPLLVCDVWEHAYYLDYQNRRADFLKVFVEKLANWKFALQNYK